MKLYRRKNASEKWQLAPNSCLYEKQENDGFKYQYFQNDAAARADRGYFDPSQKKSKK